MDCIDCHNRPAHIYNPPMRSVNHVMAIDRINPNLPYAKSLSVEVLDKPYTSKEIALDSIKTYMEEFYQANYPQVWDSSRANIELAIKEVQKIYSRNYFPSMNVSWRKFPENIGHMYSPGCFRCHDGKHISEDGKVISRNCNICHSIIAQEFDNQKPQVALDGVDYKHPVDIGNAWKQMECSSCHTREK